EMGSCEWNACRDLWRHQANAKLRDYGHVEQAEEHRDVLRIGDRIEQHELRNAFVEPWIGFEREQQGDAAAKRMADKRQVVEVLVDDELGKQIGLIEHGVALVERLVRLTKALEVHGNDPVIA